MFAYGIGNLPLIHLLKAEFPALERPWYADDAGAGGKFADIRQFFCKLQEIGPHYEYYPEPTKSILIVPQHNLEAARITFADFNFKVTMGSRYLGSFMGKDDALHSWLLEKTKNWEEAVADLAWSPPTSHKLPIQEVCRSHCSKNGTLFRQ
jgi:hypothetical protein